MGQKDKFVNYLNFKICYPIFAIVKYKNENKGQSNYFNRFIILLNKL